MKKLFTAALLSVTVLFNSSVVFCAEAASIENITGSYSQSLKNAGIAGCTAQYTGTEQSSVAIENVQTLGEHCIIVTLGSYFPDFNVSDLRLRAYTSDWYSLKANLLDRITYDKYTITTNSEGKTVVIFEINENINNNVLEDSYDDATELTDAEKEAAIQVADNEISWQLDNGGWYKAYDLHKKRAWDGKEKKNVDAKGSAGWSAADGTPCGTIDNDATYSEMGDIALAYALTGDSKYKTSFEKGIEFIKLLQYPTGGLAQVYPSRSAGSYSDYVTLNDDAMANTLIMLEKIKDGRYPYNTGVVSEKYFDEIDSIIDKATDYLIKAQIVTKGVKSAWCAQHDPVTYEPRPARAYELESISGSESVGVIKFLMHQHDNADAVAAAEAAIDWFDNNKIENTTFDKNTAPYFFEKQGSTLWYRFYDTETGVGFFSDRDGGKYYDISQISEERRTGYAWTGTWPAKIISTYQTYGYYPNRITVSVSGTTSKDVFGKTLEKNASLSPSEDNLAKTLSQIEEEPIIYGDANEDGIITAADSAYILQYCLDNSFIKASDKWLKACDVDGVAGISAGDAAYVLQKVLDSGFDFPVEK